MVEVQHWQVFPRGPAGGNPCPLVTDARDLTAGQMRAIAAHYGHESAFVTADATLRYFVPRHEMRMCVHATVAAVTALVQAGRLGGRHATISTASGEHRVSWDDGEPPEVTVEQHPPAFGAVADQGTRTGLTEALGLPADAIPADAPIQPVSVSRPKLIVPLRDADAVHKARPDYPALWDLCRRLDTTGVYIFAFAADDGRLIARQFPVDAGFPEDAATGVAAAALAAYLADPGTSGWTRVAIDQGDAMGRPSRLYAAALAEDGAITRTSVTGQAIRTGREELDLDEILRSGSEPLDPELR
jgi:trans-2,3-dihydro-3-hydroxyanthranilate isomerase